MGYCVLECEKCECFIATKNNDDALREKVAKDWTEQWKHPFTKEMINCEGCKSDGIKCGFCGICKIRACAIGKGKEKCTSCDEYPCEIVKSVFGE